MAMRSWTSLGVRGRSMVESSRPREGTLTRDEPSHHSLHGLDEEELEEELEEEKLEPKQEQEAVTRPRLPLLSLTSLLNEQVQKQEEKVKGEGGPDLNLFELLFTPGREERVAINHGLCGYLDCLDDLLDLMVPGCSEDGGNTDDRPKDSLDRVERRQLEGGFEYEREIKLLFDRFIGKEKCLH